MCAMLEQGCVRVCVCKCWSRGACVSVCDAGAGMCVCVMLEQECACVCVILEQGCVCVCARDAGAGVCVLRGGAVSVSCSHSLLPNEHPGPSSLQWTQRRGNCLSQALLSQTEPSMWKAAIQPASSLYSLEAVSRVLYR